MRACRLSSGWSPPSRARRCWARCWRRPPRRAGARADRGRAAPPVDARVDGKRVVIEGQEEVVLKCGEASITLKRDGKLILRGAYVETHAKGVNRIKGGSVKIN